MKSIFSLLIIFLSYPLFGLAQNYEKAIQQARFLVKQHQEQTNLPAVQVAVMIEGKMIWSEAFGYSDLEHRTIATPATQFRIASLSKPVTSLAL